MDDARRKAFLADQAARLFARRIGAPADLADALFALTNPALMGEVPRVNGGSGLG